MKYIKKQNEPPSLLKHRSQKNADYNNYKNKDDLRLSLLEEQGYICCYCMQRIKIDDVQIMNQKMKIEHWQCQDKYPHLQLNYNNLLAACLGNEGKPFGEQHCDTKKGNSDIKINPTDKNCETLIQCGSNGKLKSHDPDIEKDLNETLNLNINFLVKNRKDTINTVITQLNKKYPHKTWSKTGIQSLIDKLISKDKNGHYSSYCSAVIAYLRRRL
ncbi:MAG: TIGR02646 family protein [Crocosphaera sp.]|nr:TIGR02646 family protein [Crocosphaera sp.]